MSDFTPNEQERLRRVLGAFGDTAPLAPEIEPEKRVPRRRSNPAWAVTAFVVTVAVLGGAILLTRGGDSTPAVPSDTTTTQAPTTATLEAPTTIDRTTTTTTLGDQGFRVIVQPDSAGVMPPDVELGCPSGPTFPASALNSSRPLEASGLDGVEAAVRGFLDNAEGQFWPQDGWQILHQTEDAVLVVHLQLTDEAGAALDESRVSFMTVELVDGDWRWAGSSSGGPCPLRTSLPAGLNTVNWRLDPAAEPLTPSSTQIEVLVTERECVSGQAIGDRLLGPEVVMTETDVLIAFAATPPRPAGDTQTCPGNPEQAVVVELPEPLGNRAVMDGLAVAGNLKDFLN